MINRNTVLVVGAVGLSLLAGLAYAYRRCWSDSCKPDMKHGHTIDISRMKGKENLIAMLTIGSGPAAHAAALYGARGGIDTMVIEGNKPGGLLMDTTEIENWPGKVTVMGP